MRLFMQAKNNRRMEFCLLVANHAGHEIVGLDAWRQAADYWLTLFKHPRIPACGREAAVGDFLAAAPIPKGWPTCKRRREKRVSRASRSPAAPTPNPRTALASRRVTR